MNSTLSRAKSRDDIPHAIVATVTYSNYFNYPLTLKELHTRLIRAQCSRTALSQTLKQQLQTNKIESSHGYYYLPGRQHIVSLRAKRAKISAPLLARAGNLANRLALIPGVLAVYLTGSLAVASASGRDDIDLMIIARSGRLWTTRLLLTLYTTLLGLRRTPHSTHNFGKLCLNLYLTPDSFSLPVSRRSLYTAYELIQAVPLYDPSGTHPHLLAANVWLKKYLPNFQLPRNKAKIESNALEHDVGLARVIEKICYQIQLAYMYRRITRELITPDSAFFHPRDPSPKVK